MQPSKLAKHGSLLLFLGLITFYFYGLGRLPLLGPDEPRYAQVAREMFLRGDWITPTLGGHFWFEKPSLLYWMTILSYKLFGVSEGSARLAPALCGLLTIAAVYCVVRRVERVASNDQLEGFGFWSALAAGVSVGLMAFSRAVSFDIVITMTTSWSLACFLISEFEETSKRRQLWLAGFYAAIGLSLLAKGLVGFVIPFGVVILYYLFRGRKPERIVFRSLLWGTPVAILIAATWYGPMISRHGILFINRFIIEQHFARFITNKYHHPAPFYFYFLILPAFALPWTAFLLDGIWNARKFFRSAEDPASKTLIFGVAWLLLPLLFFSLSSSKLPGYILPALPAAAILVGERFARLSSGSAIRAWATKATPIPYLIVTVAAPVYALRTGALPLRCALLIFAPLALAAVFILLSTKLLATSVVLTASATIIAVIVVFQCAVPDLVRGEHSKYLLAAANARGFGATRIFGLQRDDRTPEFYAAGRVIYGSDGEPVMYEGFGPLVLESRRLGGPLLAFIPLNDLQHVDKLTSAHVEVIGNNGKYALVAVTAL